MMCCLFPLLVSKGIYHYWKNFLSLSRGLKQMAESKGGGNAGTEAGREEEASTWMGSKHGESVFDQELCLDRLD